jgi:N-acetylmuramoyl-L-alanine amidase
MSRSSLFSLTLGVFLTLAADVSRAAPGATPSGPLTGLHVALDIGHSVAKPGALSARGRGEFLFNQSTATTIAGILRAFGAKVTVINEKGTMTGLTERPQSAVEAGADLFLSIHHDSANDKYMETWEVDGKKLPYCDRFSGYSVFCSKKNLRAAESRALAIEIGAAMHKAGFKPTPHHNEPIQGENRPFIDERTAVYEFTDLVVAKSGKLPSVLLECGVIVNRDEEIQVQTKEYQQRIGNALVSALISARKKEIFGKEKSAGGSLLGVDPAKPKPAAEEPKREKILSRLLPKKKE